MPLINKKIPSSKLRSYISPRIRKNKSELSVNKIRLKKISASSHVLKEAHQDQRVTANNVVSTFNKNRITTQNKSNGGISKHLPASNSSNPKLADSFQSNSAADDVALLSLRGGEYVYDYSLAKRKSLSASVSEKTKSAIKKKLPDSNNSAKYKSESSRQQTFRKSQSDSAYRSDLSSISKKKKNSHSRKRKHSSVPHKRKILIRAKQMHDQIGQDDAPDMVLAASQKAALKAGVKAKDEAVIAIKNKGNYIGGKAVSIIKKRTFKTLQKSDLFRPNYYSRRKVFNDVGKSKIKTKSFKSLLQLLRKGEESLADTAKNMYSKTVAAAKQVKLVSKSIAASAKAAFTKIGTFISANVKALATASPVVLLVVLAFILLTVLLVVPLSAYNHWSYLLSVMDELSIRQKTEILSELEASIEAGYTLNAEDLDYADSYKVIAFWLAEDPIHIDFMNPDFYSNNKDQVFASYSDTFWKLHTLSTQVDKENLRIRASLQHVDIDYLAAANNMVFYQTYLNQLLSYQNSAVISSGQFILPVPGRSYISSYYGKRAYPLNPSKPDFHRGVDFPAAMGSDVVAVLPGKVFYVDYPKPNCDRGGVALANMIIIDHGNNLFTVYGHLKSIYVYSNKEVLQGEVIGSVGSTGYSTGPHLHFEVRSPQPGYGDDVDPLPFLQDALNSRR